MTIKYISSFQNKTPHHSSKVELVKHQNTSVLHNIFLQMSNSEHRRKNKSGQQQDDA
ncbi:MAG: hypothetical protein AB1349_13810 [Elusimicrobiota bacterium]